MTWRCLVLGAVLGIATTLGVLLVLVEVVLRDALDKGLSW